MEFDHSHGFKLHCPFQPAGDQPQAIEALVRGIKEGRSAQTLLGATGTARRSQWPT